MKPRERPNGRLRSAAVVAISGKARKISRPLRGWVAGVPFLARRMCKVARSA